MKKITIIFGLLAIVAGNTGCKKDGIDSDTSFLQTDATANSGKVFEISNDNSGKVTITPTGEGASSFVVKFGHGTGTAAQADVKPGASAIHAYPEGNYTVSIVSKSLSGKETEASYPLQVVYRAPEEVKLNPTANLHELKVKPEAKYAASFLVYFGDVANETGTPVAKGAEVAHTYATAGSYDVKVVALSGGAAKTENVTSVKIYDPFGLPITFDNPNVNDFFGTFGDNQQFAFVANPNPSGLNVSAKVGKFTRGNQGWSGTYSPLNNPIQLANGTKIKVLVYNPDPAMIGKKLNVELEGAGTPANGVAVLKVPVTKAGEWEELMFDFGTIAAIPPTAKFTQLVLRYNDAADGAGAVIYVDNFRQTN